MKKYILLIAAGTIALVSHAQITIDMSHVFSSGYKGVLVNDNNDYPIPANGANKTWDYSTLQNEGEDTLIVGHNSWFPGHQYFPTANLCIQTGTDSTYNFVKKDASELSIVGTVDVSNGNLDYNDFKLELLKFPATYNKSWVSTYKMYEGHAYIGYDYDGAGPLPKVDSIRGEFSLNAQTKIDGWGTLKLPSGNYNALKVSATRIFKIVPQMKIGMNWQDIQQELLDSMGQSVMSDTSYQIFFWTNDAQVGYPLMIMDYEEGDNQVSETQWLKTKPQVSSSKTFDIAGVWVYPNPATDVVHITNNGYKSLVQLRNLTGQLVTEKYITDNDFIDMTDLPSGTYQISIKPEKGIAKSEIIIKN